MKYIVMGNWTDQGRKTIGDIKKRIETSRNLIEEKNGSISLYYTMGEYDFVSIVDMPDEESLVKVLMKLNTTNLFKTKTLKAWTDDEFVKMVSEL
ncbi:MAG: GYD domain-containing protein [Methanobacterium sp.]